MGEKKKGARKRNPPRGQKTASFHAGEKGNNRKKVTQDPARGGNSLYLRGREGAVTGKVYKNPSKCRRKKSRE